MKSLLSKGTLERIEQSTKTFHVKLQVYSSLNTIVSWGPALIEF